jgi:hypothetical protein
MTLLGPQTIAAIMSPKKVPRALLPLYGIQLARVSSRAIERGITKKLYVFRNVPFTAVDPSPKQAAVRIAFALIAHGAKGKRWEGKYPPAAEEIMKNAELIRRAAAEAPTTPRAPRHFHSERLDELLVKPGVEAAIMRTFGITAPEELMARLKEAGFVKEIVKK